MIVYQGLALISGFSFLIYGISCLSTEQMKNEFIRFKLAKWRTLVGILQILGGLGLIIGVFVSNILVAVSAGGLALLMLMGFITRLYIKDSVIASSPAFIFMIINSLLVFAFSTT